MREKTDKQKKHDLKKACTMQIEIFKNCHNILRDMRRQCTHEIRKIIQKFQKGQMTKDQVTEREDFKGK